MLPSSAGPGRSGSTDSSLLRRVQAHDPEAWSRLVDWAGPLVLYWCRRSGLSPDDREEVFQEVFLAVAASIVRFRSDRAADSFRGWLLTITHRKIIDLGRRRLAQPRAEGGSDACQRLLALTGEELSASDPLHPDVELLRRALDIIRGDFAAQVWQAFWRTTVDGVTAPEAAAELKMTAHAVRKAKSRVLSRLRDEFRGLLG